MPGGRRGVRGLDAARARALLLGVLEAAQRGGRLRLLLTHLLTTTERRVLAQRLRVAQRLLAGDSYRGIHDLTGVSFSTIAGVERWVRRVWPRPPRVQSLRFRRHWRRRLPGRGILPPSSSSPGSIKSWFRNTFGFSI